MILRRDVPSRQQHTAHPRPIAERPMTSSRKGQLHCVKGILSQHRMAFHSIKQRIQMARCAIVVLALFVAFSGPVYAEPRIALLIGNQAYAKEVGPLKNPINDINQVGVALKKIGFTVERVENARFGDLHKAVNRYARHLQEAGDGAIGFLYYSGHGGANPKNNMNYLIPVDVPHADDTQLWDNSIRLDRIIDILRKEASRATHFVVFDACRNELQLKDTKSLFDPGKGFQPEQQNQGMLIAYATAKGKTAPDDGVYAKALSEELVKPDVQAWEMFQNVQDKVLAATGQVPWLSTPYLPKIYLAGHSGSSPSVPPTQRVDRLEPGVYLTREGSKGQRVHKNMVREEAGDLEDHSRPLSFSTDVRGSCLTGAFREGHRLEWRDLRLCL